MKTMKTSFKVTVKMKRYIELAKKKFNKDKSVDAFDIINSYSFLREQPDTVRSYLYDVITETQTYAYDYILSEGIYADFICMTKSEIALQRKIIESVEAELAQAKESVQPNEAVADVETSDVKIGQMTNQQNSLSDNADYLQLDVCGLSADKAVERLEAYMSKSKVKSVMLHGDWQKNGASENNLRDRLSDYIDIISAVSERVKVEGLTLHPPYRSKMDVYTFMTLVEQLEKHIPVFVENRSNNKIHLSTPDDIAEYSKYHLMTIDIPQLFINVGFDMDKLMDALLSFNLANVKEYHLGNVVKKDKHTFVARRLNDGLIDYSRVFKIIPKESYLTLEILGGTKVFEEQVNYINTLIK